MLKIKKIQPIGSQVLVTKNVYDWDDFEEGILLHKRGDLKSYQKVVSVGSDVKFVKPGDLVEINYYKYVVLKEDQNSVKAIGDNDIIGLRLNEVDMVDFSGKSSTFFLIDQRDIKYILKDYEEVKYDATINTENPSQIILPNQSFRV